MDINTLNLQQKKLTLVNSATSLISSY